MEINSHQQLTAFAGELSNELHHILNNWSLFNFKKSGVITNARILWAYAAAFNAKAAPDLDMADKAYHEVVNRFLDIDYGGVFLTVDDNGKPNNTKKEIYALACTLFAFSEYFMACGDDLVKERALMMFHDLVKNGHDVNNGGYFEIFSRSWESPTDFVDAHATEKKTMNTQLEVLEAYTNLYRMWPDKELKNLIVELLNDFAAHVLYAKASEVVSLGNDLKASWLLPMAAAVIDHVVLMAAMKTFAIELAQPALAAFTKAENLWSVHKHCWIVAEAMIGFFNAWEISGDKRYLNASLKAWSLVKSTAAPIGHRESCYFFNSRACLELSKRLNSLNY